MLLCRAAAALRSGAGPAAVAAGSSAASCGRGRVCDAVVAAHFRWARFLASGSRGGNGDGGRPEGAGAAHDDEDPGAYEPADPELAVPAREIVLASRPAVGAAVTLDNFCARDLDLRAESDGGKVPRGKVLVRTMWLSVDPFMRCRFNDDTGVEYTAPYAEGAPITSAGIGYVQLCGRDVRGLAPGDLVIDPFDGWPWQSDALLDADDLTRVPQSLAALVPVEQLLGNVGLSGLTALHGVEDAGRVSRGDVLVVSGAAGSVGLVAVQVAKRAGATVVGVCGTEEKAGVLKQLGADAAVVYKGKGQSELTHAIADAVAPLCSEAWAQASDEPPSFPPRAATVYFDNVGGAVSEAVIPLLAPGARIVICGQIASYDTDEPYPPPVSPAAQATLDEGRISRERFLVLNHAPRFAESLSRLCRMSAAGELVQRTAVTDGLENAPSAFVGMMSGANTGKALVRCAEAPPSARAWDALRGVLPATVRGWLSGAFATPEAFEPTAATGGGSSGGGSK